MNLYEISVDLAVVENKMDEWALEHEGDISDFPLLQELEALEEQKEEKALNIGCLIKNLKSKAESIKKEGQILKKRQKVFDNKINALKQVLESIVPTGQKYESPRCVISWRKSKSIDITCEAKDLPGEYQKIIIEPSKNDLKEAIIAGETIDGVDLLTNNNIQIK